MKKLNMNDLLGLNWQLLLGIFLLCISIGFIIFGLNNNLNSKTFFNIASLMALLSVAGIWYFGNINTKMTNLELEQNRNEAKQAISKTAQIELDLTIAKKETQEAKVRTEEVRLEVESAKIEQEKLRKQTLILERQNQELKIEADRIKSFRIFVYVEIEHDGKIDKIPHTVTDKKGGILELFDLNDISFQKFRPVFGMLSCESPEKNKLLYRVEYVPINDNPSKYSIEKLNSINKVYLELHQMFNEEHRLKEYHLTKPVKITCNIQINEIQILSFSASEKQIGEFLKSDNYYIIANDAFKQSYKSYMEKVGRNK